MKEKDAHTLKCRSTRETENAILIELDDGTSTWIPFSQVDRIVREPNGIDIEITISRWIAKQKGLI